jgi:hypothetical protein
MWRSRFKRLLTRAFCRHVCQTVAN